MERSFREKLLKRKKSGRQFLVDTVLKSADAEQIDFLTTDSLGFGRDKTLITNIVQKLSQLTETKADIRYVFGPCRGKEMVQSNKSLVQETILNNLEQKIAKFHNMKHSFLFKSGFAANLDFLSCIASPSDVIIFDEYCHKSMMTAFQLSRTQKRIAFKHNNLNDLAHKLHQIRSDTSNQTKPRMFRNTF